MFLSWCAMTTSVETAYLRKKFLYFSFKKSGKDYLKKKKKKNDRLLFLCIRSLHVLIISLGPLACLMPLSALCRDLASYLHANQTTRRRQYSSINDIK